MYAVHVSVCWFDLVPYIKPRTPIDYHLFVGSQLRSTAASLFSISSYVWQGPLTKTGVIDVFKQKYLTPSIGSEFSDFDLVEALKSPMLIRYFAI